MFGRNQQRALILAMVVALTGAGETGTEPEDLTSFDAEAALADYEAMDVIFSSDAMEGFRAMGAGISFQGLAPEMELVVRLGEALALPGNESETRAMAGGIFSAVSDLGPGPFNTPIISPLRRGKTFVYDADLGRYAIDPGLEGAPATGVRFILYSPGTDGKPDPTSEIGHADLIDEGDGSAEDIALRLVVVEGADTVLDYRTTLDIMDQGGKITVDGYLQGETDRLDFDLGVTGSVFGGENKVNIDFEMGIPSRSFLITGSVSGVENDSGEGGEIDLLVEHGPDSFQVDVTGSDTLIDGTFYLNGKLFATITGDPDDPTLTSATGEPLTWAEVLVLRQIIDSTEDVFDFWEDLLDPVDELVILAIIL